MLCGEETQRSATTRPLAASTTSQPPAAIADTASAPRPSLANRPGAWIVEESGRWSAAPNAGLHASCGCPRRASRPAPGIQSAIRVLYLIHRGPTGLPTPPPAAAMPPPAGANGSGSNLHACVDDSR